MIIHRQNQDTIFWIFERFDNCNINHSIRPKIINQITGYNQYNESVAADGYSSKVKLTVTINVVYVNNTNHDEDFERQFSAYRVYDSTQLLTEVQDQLIGEMVKEITEQIFNSTVANW